MLLPGPCWCAVGLVRLVVVGPKAKHCSLKRVEEEKRGVSASPRSTDVCKREPGAE